MPLPEEGVRAQPNAHQLGSNVAPIIVPYGYPAATPNSAPMTYVSPSTGREIKAVLFDTFGSVVDWRSGVARDVAAFAEHHRIDVDATAFADAWRAKDEPSMGPNPKGSPGVVPLPPPP